jgi:hypothetical protein
MSLVPIKMKQGATKLFGSGLRPKPCASEDLHVARSTQARAETEFCRVFRHWRQKSDRLRVPSFVPFGPMVLIVKGQDSSTRASVLSLALQKTYSKRGRRKLGKTWSFVPIEMEQTGQNSSA